MKLDGPARYALLRPGSNDFDRNRVIAACEKLVARLSDIQADQHRHLLAWHNRQIEAAGPRNHQKNGWPHVLGIVACDSSERKFLALEPWPGNTTDVYYGSKKTRFLAVIEYKEYNPSNAVLEYKNGITGVKGSCVLALNAF